MSRIRTVKPDFWFSEKLGRRLRGADGRQARLLAIAILNFCEDHGVARGDPHLLKAQVFPYDDVSAEDVTRWLELLEGARYLVRYQLDGWSYVHVCGFNEHQRINRPSGTTLPLPTKEELNAHGGLTEDSLSPHGPLTVGREGKGKEGNGVVRASGAAAKPRKLSEQEEFAAWFEGQRRERLGEDWAEDKHLSVGRLNNELIWLRGADKPFAQAAALLFFEDARRGSQDPPFSLLWFSRDRAEYISKAKRSAIKPAPTPTVDEFGEPLENAKSQEAKVSG